FEAVLQNNVEVKVNVLRFLSLEMEELGAIKYEVTPLNEDAKIGLVPYLDGDIKNEDTNWDDQFWETLDVSTTEQDGFIQSRTMKTNFHVCTFMRSNVYLDNVQKPIRPIVKSTSAKIEFDYNTTVKKGQKFAVCKDGGYTVDRNHDKNGLRLAAEKALEKASELGFDQLLSMQKRSWEKIWDMADITIKGDEKGQQGIRFNIFQLNQTYLGTDARLNIGPKGFTGEKYGGSTYWDTEAYCIPFYMATKDQEVARNLLEYRYNHLEKAIENAEKLGFSNGAALYPMVTMNGEECHNEWEITFEEIHRNGAIAFAIFNYYRFTNDFSYIPEKGLEVLIAISRFWQQRATYSTLKNKYVILGVTGPNEYENNVNNNWYTNYIAKWCIQFTLDCIERIKNEFDSDHTRILNKVKLSAVEMDKWKEVADNLYFPYSEEHNVYLQQDGFLDKEQITVSDLPKSQRPINQFWSWDRILRSPYIKQADVLQGFYFFEDHFSQEELKRHFDFYEPFTVHESSLSPCVHSVQAAKLGQMEQAYQFYLRTSRLDLDDYNKEVHEGLHITSMAGTWMSIVEGFGGMRIKNNMLCFKPQIPKEWNAYSFKINFRGQILKVNVTKHETNFELDGHKDLQILVNDKLITITPNNLITV
ncbi:MAG: glycoside hydrolase family 65 protein, partial [Flavobacteriaceae bacterium]|nr:glycoside hydrolase family 65 protein [Flavobacteriaceae bacterium]